MSLLVRKLDEVGFIIVDKNAAYQPPAGRGNEAYKKVKEDRRIRQVVARRGVYTGPDLIGKSHTQSLLNGGISS